MVIRLGERDLQTRFGMFREVLYYDGQHESIALILGEIVGGENVLVRVHSACIGGHVFSSIECTCREEMEAAQAAIQNEGRGVIIYLDQEGKGNGHLAIIKSMEFKKEFGQAEAYVKAGFKADARDYRPAAEILKELGVTSIILLSGSSDKADELAGYSVTVTGRRSV